MDKNSIHRTRRTLWIVGLVAFASVVLPLGLNSLLRYSMDAYYGVSLVKGDASLREFPYPYKAAVCIASDIDGTSTLKEFLTIQEFLNTDRETPLGRGLKLEIGNSFFPNGKDFSLTYDQPSQDVIVDLILLGYVDVMHSFNDAHTRDDIKSSVDFLKSKGCAVNVWVNHSYVSSDVGSYDFCLGDDPDSPVYHTDLSFGELRCSFVWIGQTSGILGQGKPIGLTAFWGAFDPADPWGTFFHYPLKNVSKYLAALSGNWKYQMYRFNELVQVTSLDDGREVFEFSRCNYSYGGVWGRKSLANAVDLAEALRTSILQKLIDAGGYSAIYTHLGKGTEWPYLPASTCDALRGLAHAQESGDIYVTTTSKLLSYYVNKRYLQWSASTTNDSTVITITGIDDPVRGRFMPDRKDLQGLTFYTHNPRATKVVVRDRAIEDLQLNQPDETGMASVGVNLTRLPNIDEQMKEYKQKGYF